MKRDLHHASWRAVLPAALILVVLPSLGRGEECPHPIGRVAAVQGLVECRRGGQPSLRILAYGDTLCMGDIIYTRSRSSVAIVVGDENVLRLDHEGEFAILPPQEAKGFWLSLTEGVLHFLSQTRQRLKVDTRFVTASIEGTEFIARSEPARSEIIVVEGIVSASNAWGEVTLFDGEAASAVAGSPPARYQVVKPLDLVQWALYYPRIGAEQAASPEVRQAAELLRVGRSDEAEPLLAEAVRKDSGDAAALALQAIIAVAQNRNAAADELAASAIAADPDAAIAHLARSYARQARFDIEGALASVEQAVELAPENAHVWARLAELQSSLGRLRAAQRSARRAVSLQPQLSRTQTVLGFAHLARIEIDKAVQAFEEAIQFDQADPLPRLGLGLALIRRNRLAAGREQLELAVSLDPNQSLLRSYLGKAYFEERRDAPASAQYGLAKSLDPNDPTPWFYDAIRKQAANQPVAALRDIETSIDKNQNRAVYRSRLLLDQDRAMRGVSLSRVYDDLGFERRAILESAHSLNLDPGNYSAHRFLSDAYADLPRHEGARVSELFQAQMLQPLNVTPIQPQRAFTDLNVASRISPADITFNEYTPLFERNRPQLNASGVAGTSDTLGDEVVVSGLQDRFSYSGGQFHFQTDGYRDNNDIEHDIYNAFGQLALIPEIVVQAEYRKQDTSLGDLGFFFDRDAFDPFFRDEIELEIARAGLSLGRGPDARGLLSFSHADRTERSINARGAIGVEREQEGIQIDAQYVGRAGGGPFVVGYLRYDFDADTLVELRSGRLALSDVEGEVEQDTGYLYWYPGWAERLHLTLGFAYDDYQDTDNDIDVDLSEFNPKVGGRVRVRDWLTVRAAYVETLKRRLPANQSLEPTQVAGFPQFFDDLDASSAERLGFGVDLDPLDTLRLGADWNRRDVTARFSVIGAETDQDNIDERIGRVYALWTPIDQWAVGARYEYDDYQTDATDTQVDPLDLETHTGTIDVRWFHPRGWLAQAGATFVGQEVVLPTEEGPAEERDSSFALFDVSVGFRFPQRRGMVAVAVNNLFDESFDYQSDNFRTSALRAAPYLQERSVALKVTVSL